MPTSNQSGLYIFANRAVPASMNYPHDKVGGTGPSAVLLYFVLSLPDPPTMCMPRPRTAVKADDEIASRESSPHPGYYPELASDIDRFCSPAGQFLSRMEKIQGWKTMELGTLCQAEQLSSYPSKYQLEDSTTLYVCQACGVLYRKLNCSESLENMGQIECPSVD